MPRPTSAPRNEAWRRAYDAVAATRLARGVPTFKFTSNDGWIVLPDECLAIAAALRACVVDDSFTSRVNEMSDSIDEAVRAALEAMGHPPASAIRAPMSQPELARWITGFAAWNEVAATAGGYTVS